MASDSNLPPIDFQEDKKYEPYEEVTEIKFNKCNHSKAKIVGNELRCSCGVGFTGSRLDELLKLLQNNADGRRSNKK